MTQSHTSEQDAKLELLAKHDYLTTPVFIAEWITGGFKVSVDALAAFVELLEHVTNGYPTCTVTVDRQTRVNLLMYSPFLLDEIKLLDEVVESLVYHIDYRRLRSITGLGYTVGVRADKHGPTFEVHFCVKDHFFTFPHHVTVLEYADMDYLENHHEECPVVLGESDCCNCEPYVVEKHTLHQVDEDKWEPALRGFIKCRVLKGG